MTVSSTVGHQSKGSAGLYASHGQGQRMAIAHGDAGSAPQVLVILDWSGIDS